MLRTTYARGSSCTSESSASGLREQVLPRFSLHEQTCACQPLQLVQERRGIPVASCPLEHAELKCLPWRQLCQAAEYVPLPRVQGGRFLKEQSYASFGHSP